MRLDSMRGKRQLQVVGKLMVLADSLTDDPDFQAFLSAMKSDEGRDRSILKIGALLARDDVSESVVDIVAFAKGVDPDDVDDPMGEIMELLSSDLELTPFLSAQQ